MVPINKITSNNTVFKMGMNQAISGTDRNPRTPRPTNTDRAYIKQSMSNIVYSLVDGRKHTHNQDDKQQDNVNDWNNH
jgi:hypothetical protein